MKREELVDLTDEQKDLVMSLYGKAITKKDKEITTAIKKLEEDFSGNGRVLIRPSGTEPKVRVMIEGTDIDYITKRAQELADLIENKLK